MPPLSENILKAIELSIIAKLAPVLTSSSPAGPCDEIIVVDYIGSAGLTEAMQRYRERANIAILSSPTCNFTFSRQVGGLAKMVDMSLTYQLAGVFGGLDTRDARRTRLFDFFQIVIDSIGDAIIAETDVPEEWKPNVIRLSNSTPIDDQTFSAMIFSFDVRVYGRAKNQ